MPKYHARYVKEHYIKRDIKRELYEAFIEWCGEKSINICLEKALSILRGNIPLNVRGNIAPNTGEKALSILEANITPNIGANTAPNTRANQSKKSKVRGLKSFLK
jgi:hypothetical protein